MIQGLVLACLLAIAATATSAQNLRVRSGEHDGYTRLVVQVPGGAEWNLRQLRNAAELNVPVEGAVYETGSVFDRLSENRLTSVSQTQPGDALALTFGCDCVARAFLHRGTMVVIDIAPGQFTPPPASLPQTWSGDKSADPKLPTGIPSSALALPLWDLSRRDLESQLMSRILQGVDRDVVDLDLSDVGPRPSTAMGPLRIPKDLTSNLQVTSVLDELRGLGGMTEPRINPIPACITDAELDFDAWSGTQPFDHQVARLRTGLFQEFDRIQPDSAMKLAKLYTYNSFGAEAVQVLNLLSEQSKAKDRIAAIAYVMDDRPIPEPNPFANQQRCDGDAALWAVLTEQELQPEANLNVIEQSFVGLPPHLRHLFGPALVDTLVKADKLEASRRVLRAVERLDAGNRPELGLARAKISDTAGDDVIAKTLLSDVATSSQAAKDSALALARLIEKRWSDRGAVSRQNLDLAAAYAVELRRSELGPMMARSHALALSLNQEFSDAISLIRSSPEDKDWRRTHDQVLQVLADRADDVTFLHHALNLSPKTRDQLSLEAAITLSERLAALGFAQQAFALANRPKDTVRRGDRARLRAHAAILNARPRQALLEVSDDETDEARQIRAQALVQAGDYAQAATVLRQMGQVDAAARYFWLAGLTDEAGAAGKFGNLARLGLALGQSIERTPEKPLADATALLEESRQARGLITDLLNAAGETTE